MAAAHPWVTPRFYRAHGLGNDYLVFEGGDGAGLALGPAAVRRICARGEGEGSDGIVVLLDRSPPDGVFPLRMFNPDGTEFERSGNGLRVLASHLRREGLVHEGTFRVRTGGEEIRMTIHPGAPPGVHDVSVELGTARAGDGALPVESGHLDGEGRVPRDGGPPVEFTPVWVGNPHAVVFDHPARIGEVGPLLTAHPAFPSGVNVQTVEVRAPDVVRIRIWERGVGPTSASGTSSCAAVVAAVHARRIEPGSVRVEMPGGVLHVGVTGDLEVTLRGPVAEVAEGRLTPGFVASLGRSDDRSGPDA